MSTVTAATVEAVLRVRDLNFTASMTKADQQTKKALNKHSCKKPPLSSCRLSTKAEIRKTVFV